MISVEIPKQEIIIKLIPDKIYNEKLRNKIEEYKNKLGEEINKIGEKTYFYGFRSKYDVGVSIMKYIKTNKIAENLTNAGIKLLEIIKYYNLVNKDLRIFFNAELPGSFVYAMKYYTFKEKIKMEWIASSYVPDKNNTALEDKFGLWKNNPDKWLMNKNFNGDITSIENLKYIMNYFSNENNKVDLYTSDIGGVIDYTKDSELEMIQLDFMQAIYGLISLRKGGSMVLKQFSFFHGFNMSLILIYSSMFEKFYISKPSTSRPINSEIYLIGVNFIKLNININEIINNFTNISSLLNLNLYDISSLLKAQEILYEQQIYHLNELIKFIQTKKQNDNYIKKNNIIINNYITSYL